MKKYIILFFLLIITRFYAIEPLSDGYKDIKLGMSMDQVKALLQKSGDFIQKKEEVLITRLEPDTKIISVEGVGFIIYAYFHFENDKLFQIFLKISDSKIGYYFLLRKLTSKFGNPKKFNPKKAIWENDNTRIILEKPCNLKYIYLPVWNDIIKNEEKREDIIKIIREKFGDDL